MNELIDFRTRAWAAVAVVVGLVLLIAIDLIEEPDSSALDIVLNLLEIAPVVMTSVGVALLFRVALRQREENLQVIHDIEIARVQGQRWRSEARSYLDGLGQAIETQFSRWNLTEAEREVALLLLKGLSTKEVAQVRSVSERTVREQARSIYAKAGLTGRAALSAFFLEDLLAPIEGLQ
ncbi:LuxR C-terminal-related transcriptional regulator [Lysobacter sp. CFH 32150]|uniref:helix-turn-helix transcriptional regulator n=1 Tax=Lysobacter sp. CFH 32150 TaxID=2927128 RepID=UPI001FA6B693|nr:LuxR C-terminal-related transcriptional regulator [Lysobacter sp. CFH 32150]MCI4567069.1 LuxR C-terminal-related transcriptional regulator [Lysobacter sp. CFH 32150]